MGFPKPSTAPPMPIPPKPPWYSTPTVIVPLPTAVSNCNSPIESPPDTRPATENCKNNNDRPDDDDNNDDVDCFPRQDKQPVIPQQDISPTDTLPSLIESTTDTPTDSTDNKNKNDPSGDDDNDDDDVNCFLRQDRQDTQPNLLTKQQRLPFSFPAYTHNPTQAPCKLPTKRTQTK